MSCCNNIYPESDLRRWESCDSVQLANADNYYTKKEVDDLLDDIVVSGDGITADEAQDLIDSSLQDYYDKDEIDAAFDTVNNELANKLDASAYTPTDLSQYWTSAETAAVIEDNEYVISQAINELKDTKQDVLVSGENIKTINGISLVGEGNVEIGSGGTTDLSNYYTKSETNDLLDDKLDASAYTPTDLSGYWTSGETQAAINAATSGIPSSQTIEGLRSDINALSGDVYTNYYTKSQVDALIEALQAQIDDLSDCCSGSGDTGSTEGMKWVLHMNNGQSASLICDAPNDQLPHQIDDDEFVHTHRVFNTDDELSSITSAYVGECVYGIMDNGFSGCTNMSSITVSDNLAYIGANAFRGCENLENFPYSSGLEVISGSAFAHCYSLTHANIPSGVTSIGSWAFQDCTGLTQVVVEGTTPPTLGNWAFYNEYGTAQLNIPIYVPASAENTYKTAAGWSEYASRIIGIPMS